jgi:hypothetical protein
MADWSLPTLSSTYTNFLAEVKNRDVDLALQFDGTTSTNLATGTIRWNSAANTWQKWTGSAWGALSSTFAFPAIALSGTQPNIALNGTTNNYVNFQTNSVNIGYVGDANWLFSGGSSSDFGVRATNNLTFGIGASEKLRIDSSGNVGIGGTPSIYKLDSVGNGLSTRESANSSRLIFGTYDAVGINYIAADKIGTGSYQSLAFQTGGSERLRIDSSGRVGIGTSSPTSRLDLGTPGNAIFFNATNGVDSTLRFTFASTLTTIGNAGGAAGLALETNGTERLRIDSSGRVGIGTSSPGELLDLSATTDPKIQFTDVGNVISKIGISGSTALTFEHNGSERLRIDASGRLLVGASTASGNALLQVAGDAQIQSLNGGQLAGTRNRIINGDMLISQRYTTSSPTFAIGAAYVLDRWWGNSTTAGNMRVGISTDVPTGAGFLNSQKADAVTGTTLVASSTHTISQKIEGYNVSDLNFGTASAATVTLSFWVKSSITGTHSGALRNANITRSYVFTYSISAANTWEKKAITIPGDTTGTWVKDNGIGVHVDFDLGNGSDYRTTAGAWTAGNFVGVTGAASVMATAGANWFITGVQFEPGTVATPYERLEASLSALRCFRYYISAAVGTFVYNNTLYSSVQYPVAMRAVAFITLTAGTIAGYSNLGFHASNTSTTGAGYTADAEL